MKQGGLTPSDFSDSIATMARAGKPGGGRPSGAATPRKTRRTGSKPASGSQAATRGGALDSANPEVQRQLQLYEQAMELFHKQKLYRASQLLEKVVAGPSKELADRARVHLRICQRRLQEPAAPVLRTADDFYHHGVAMMNLGRWDEARQALENARKIATRPATTKIFPTCRTTRGLPSCFIRNAKGRWAEPPGSGCSCLSPQGLRILAHRVTSRIPAAKQTPRAG